MDSVTRQVKAPSRRFTAVPQSGRLELALGNEVSRILIILLGDFLARIHRRRRPDYDGDLDLASVFDIIAIGAISHIMRDARFHEEHATYATVVGVEGQRGINALSISAATDIPRETVRRKIKKLLEMGVIMEKTHGHYIAVPGIFQTPKYQESFAIGVRETVNFMNQCLEQGVIRWVPNSKKVTDKS